MINIILGGLFLIVCLGALWALMEVQEMSDKDREALGHGPKGQGK